MVERVAAPPYDVVDRAEAAALAARNPLSFLHVGRAEIDLPPDLNPYDDRVYQKARQNLRIALSDGTFIREAKPAAFAYELSLDGRSQLGAVGCVHVDDYERDVIKKHERTRKEKEDDRTRHILTLDAHAEPVFLTYPASAFIDRLNAPVKNDRPLYDFESSDGVRHRVWRVADPSAYADGFRRVFKAYVADGHHRSASAWRAARERRASNPKHTGLEEYNWFPAVLFPSNQVRILPYNRLVRDLNGRTAEQVLEQLRTVGTLSSTASPSPPRRGSFGVHLAGHWYLLELPADSILVRDPVLSLDAGLLQERVLGPILGVGDVRTDPRIGFVGGIRGTAELERQVASGQAAIAFSLFPVTVDDLIAVAEAGGIMPPKTTWFEPKLKSGLFVHTLD